MPCDARNSRLSDAGLEPRASVKAFLPSFLLICPILPRKQPVGSLLARTTHGFDCSEGIQVQIGCANGSILGLLEVNGTAIHVHLAPVNRVLLRKTHPSVR